MAPPVVTIGSFDGVHLGHSKLISRIVEQSGKSGGESVILTFFPHPKMVLNPEEHGVELLSSTQEKIALLEKSGIDTLIIQPFSRDFSEMTAEVFIREVISGALQTKHLVIGYDHRFGNRRSGGIADLQVIGHQLGFTVEEIPEQEVDAMAVSSSRIRTALKSSEIPVANNLLGRPYSLTGLVVRGERLGTTLGFPTANIQVKESYKLVPAEGVYVAQAEIGRAHV